MTTVVLGSQWGDEGKGKLVDLFSQSTSICLRAAGGHNAGHTVVIGSTVYDFHILPSGLISPSCDINLIGAGTVVHVPSFFSELEALKAKGLEGCENRVWISDRAHVCFDLHQVVDGLEEGKLGARKVGTTGKGIGPCYSDKAARRGVRMAEIFEEEVFERKLRSLEEGYRRRFGEDFRYDVQEEIQRFQKYRSLLRPFVIDQVPLIAHHERKHSPILVEGANALMLDLDYGTYPYVTSSFAGLGGAIQGLGLNPFQIESCIGVVKAYSTRVGSGPFPSEQLNEVGEKLQNEGREFGVTTGRKRRCGWLDLVVVRYSAAVNHYTALNLTKLDVLDGFEEIKVATEYWVDGKMLESFPADLELLEKVEVRYETLPGWKSKTIGVTRWEDLPERAREYVQFIEKFLDGLNIRWIGTGPGREHMIAR